MERGNADRSKFRSVVDHIAQLIYNGDMLSGEHFFSRQDICDRYNISTVTAFKVQKALRENGLISSIPGQGFVVNVLKTPKKSRLQPLKRIVSIGSENSIGPGTIVGEAIMRGLATECELHGLNFTMEYADVLQYRPGAINNSRNLAPDEGLAVFLCSSLLPEIVTLLLSNGSRCSTINESFPGHPAVLSDNGHCVRELLQALHQRSCRRVLWAGYFGNYTPNINEAEMLENFITYCPQFGMEYQECLSGNYPELMRESVRFRADAIIFTENDCALHFRRLWQKECAAPLPLLAGCNGVERHESSYPELISYRVNYEEMGRCAVRQLLSVTQPVQSVRNIRVRGKMR